MIILYHLKSPNKIIKSFDNDEEMINFCKIKYKITADDLNAVEKFSYENPQFPYGIQRYYTYSNYCTICDEYGICDMITHFETDHHLRNKHKVNFEPALHDVRLKKRTFFHYDMKNRRQCL